ILLIPERHRDALAAYRSQRWLWQPRHGELAQLLLPNPTAVGDDRDCWHGFCPLGANDHPRVTRLGEQPANYPEILRPFAQFRRGRGHVSKIGAVVDGRIKGFAAPWLDDQRRACLTIERLRGWLADADGNIRFGGA